MPALLLALLVGMTAVAQPLAPMRERVERRITLPTSPGEAVPQVHVAPGVVTLLLFDAPLERTSLELEGRVSRFKLVDVGESALNVQPSAEWAPEERLGLRVRLKDGGVAALVLTTHPTRVDTRVDLARPRTPELLEAELARKSAELAALKATCGTRSPSGPVLAALLTGLEVRHLHFADSEENTSGLKLKKGASYRGRAWAAVVVELRNLPGQKPWSPRQVRLSHADGRQVQVLSVQMENPVLAPGEQGTVVVQTQAPDWQEGEGFQLDLGDRGGERLLSIKGVRL